MKSRIFVVTLVAASLMSFGAFAHGRSGPSLSISHSNIAVAVVTQLATKGGTNIAVVNQNSPISVHIGGYPE
jgi:hypothetical protein